jgi:hypothetical protein
VFLFLGLGLSGCVVHTRPHRARTVYVVKERKCHPSEYWDGDRCRHKGGGHHKHHHHD